MAKYRLIIIIDKIPENIKIYIFLSISHTPKHMHIVQAKDFTKCSLFGFKWLNSR